jgi:hypothetical protein
VDAVLHLELSSAYFALLAAGVVAAWWRINHPPPYRPRRRSRAAQNHTLAARRSYRLRAEAERRAEQMLKEILGEFDFQRLIRRGYLEVLSPNFPHRTYLVPERQGPVTVCENGRPMMRLCVQCVERVPDYDTIAMHKLMIEGNEPEYLRIANRV